MQEVEEEDDTSSTNMINSSNISSSDSSTTSSSSSSSSSSSESDDDFSYQGSVDTLYSFQVDQEQAAEPFVIFGSQAFFSISVKRNSSPKTANHEDDGHVDLSAEQEEEEVVVDDNNNNNNNNNHNDSDDENGTFFIYRGRAYEIHPDPHVVTKIKVHRSVGTELPNRAFRNCAILVQVQLPQTSGMTKIGVSAFEDCSSLTDIELPSTIQEIKTNAFWACKSLRSLELPEGLRIVGIGAFAYCTSLETVKYPSTLKEIRDGGFHWNCELTTVYLKEGIRRIGKDAFSHCESLVNVNIPRTVRQITKGCFDGCKQLLSVELAFSSLQDIGSFAFHMCESLRLVYFPLQGAIENGAFFACQDLQVVFDNNNNHNIDENDEGATTAVGQMQDWICQLVGHRLDDLPLHRLCYKQACESANNQVTHAERIAQVLQQQQQQQQRSEQTSTVNLLVDGYGMTALHILALSVKPNVSLFEQMRPVYPKPAAFLMMQDKWNTTPLEYLCHNRAPGIMELLQSMMEWGFETRIQYLGLVQWKQEVQFEMDGFVTGGDLFGGSNISSSRDTLVAERKEQLHAFLLKLLHYERLEALSLLECALWKSKLEQQTALLGTNNDISRVNTEDRSLCRFRCGADVVIVNVLGFLGPVRLPVVTLETLQI